jgi:hypothetical protein
MALGCMLGDIFPKHVRSHWLALPIRGKRARTGLPDCFFSDQIYKFGHILEDIAMENVIKFSGHSEFFTTVGYILWAFGTFVLICYIFSALVYCTEKNLATLARL